MIHATPSFDEFDPFRGYEDFIKEHFEGSREEWFEYVPKRTMAQNAYYQGFITKAEYDAIRLNSARIEIDGTLYIYLGRCLGLDNNTSYRIKLTKERALRIQSRLMLGIDEGKTLVA